MIASTPRFSVHRWAGIDWRICRTILAASLIGACIVGATAQDSAQAAQNATPKPKTAKHASHHAKKSRAAEQAAPPVAVRPPDPPPPDWPIDDQAKPASVAWNGRDLSITATNSSLEQILHDVSTATGIKVEGLPGGAGGPRDQRIYGSYGPAQARDVLNQLLDGSGLNVVMVGDRGQGTPRELLLTAQVKGAAATPAVHQPNPNAEDDAPEDPEPAQAQPEPARQPFNVPGQPGPGRTPQEMLREMQQRQLLQQQQQQQQQNQPPNSPNE